MALIKAGIAVGEMSGKSGGSIFARNKAGMYIKAWAKPTNPRTDPQTLNRSNFSLAATTWRSDLSDAEREAWNIYAAGTPLAGRFGDPMSVSGFSMYVRSNNFLLGAGESLLSAAPPLPGIPANPGTNHNSLSDSSSDTPNNLAYTDQLSWITNGFWSAQLSNPVSFGVKNYKGPFNPAIYVTANGSPPSFIFTQTVSTLSRYFIRLRQIDNSGRLSSPVVIGPITPVHIP